MTANKPTDAEQELRNAADRAYCLYIEKMRTNECLGWEEKVRTRRFGQRELEAHTKAGVFLGMHRALSKAAEVVAKCPQPAMPADAAPILAPKHTGMMVDYTGLIGQARAALNHGDKAPAMSELLRQLAVHMSQLGQRWYAGDAKVVDEFLQLYCIEQDARRRIEGE